MSQRVIMDNACLVAIGMTASPIVLANPTTVAFTAVGLTLYVCIKAQEVFSP